MLCGRRVARLVVAGGRCAGVETEDGERFMAREAVVSTIHVKHLLEMAPAELWPEDFRYGIDTFDVGVSAMARPPGDDRAAACSRRSDEPRTAVSAGPRRLPART